MVFWIGDSLEFECSDTIKRHNTAAVSMSYSPYVLIIIVCNIYSNVESVLETNKMVMLKLCYYNIQLQILRSKYISLMAESVP
jgi:hypothetical protein